MKTNGRDRFDRAIERELGHTSPQRHIDVHGSEPRGFYQGQEGAQEPDWRSSFTEYDFTGVGPKGFRRSNESVREEVWERLAAHPDIDPSEVEVTVVSEGLVELDGTVEDRWTKRAIERECDQVDGVRDVRNRLRLLQH